MPRRPTKAWWKRCIRGVTERGGAVDPASVCGAVWARKPLKEREAIARAEGRRNPAGANVGLVAAGIGVAGLVGWLLLRTPAAAAKKTSTASVPALTSPPDAPQFESSSQSFADASSPGVDLWVDTRLPEGGWNGWVLVGRFDTTYETPPGGYVPQRVDAQDKVAAWLRDHASDLSGAWSSATWTGALYEDVRYGLFGADVQAAGGDPIATYDRSGALEKGYV